MTLAPDDRPQDVEIDGVPFPGLPPEKTKWPKVISIISIVIGSLGFGLALYSTLRIGTAQQQQLILFEYPDWYLHFLYYENGVEALLGLLLIGAGIATLCRHTVGLTAHLAYSGLQIVRTFVSLAIVLVARAEMDELPGEFITLPVMLYLLFYIAYPVFLLVWFMRRKIREEVQSWRRGGGGILAA